PPNQRPAVGAKIEFRSGKGAALPPLPPLRTGRDSFPSSGSSRCKAPRERSRCSRRFNPGFMAVDAELFAERTFCKVVLPVWIERIRLRPDFQMPPDFGVAGINQFQPNGFPLRRSLSGIRRKPSSTPVNEMEVSL